MRSFTKKSVISFVLMLSVALSTIGVFAPRVNADGNTLDMPTNLRWEGTKAVWDEVEGANYYTVYLTHPNSAEILEEHQVYGDTSFDFAVELETHGAEAYRFKVQAVNMSTTPYTVSEIAYSEAQFYVPLGLIGVWNMSATIDVPSAGQTPFTTVTSGDPSKYDTLVALCMGQPAWFKGGTIYNPGDQMSSTDTFEAGETYLVRLLQACHRFVVSI